MSPRPRILCVDDDEHVLEGLRDTLHKSFDVTTCASPVEALERLDSEEPFEVVVSDMRMPVMNGATFLAGVRVKAPATVRILLTGQADLDSAIDAVNKGEIFRFLTKPSPREVLLPAIAAGVRQHRLITSEQVLLEQTVPGCVKVLVDVLTVACPEAGSRARRLERYASELAAAARLESRWEVETAALLSQLEAVSLPTETLERLDHGDELEPDEEQLVELLPPRSARHLSPIPRFETVVEMLVRQAEPSPNGLYELDLVSAGARILRIVHDYDLLATRTGMTPALAIATMRGRWKRYDDALLDKFAGLVGVRGRAIAEERHLGELEEGMTIVSPVSVQNGAMLLPRGQLVTDDLLAQIRKLPARNRGQVVVALLKRR